MRSNTVRYFLVEPAIHSSEAYIFNSLNLNFLKFLSSAFISCRLRRLCFSDHLNNCFREDLCLFFKRELKVAKNANNKKEKYEPYEGGFQRVVADLLQVNESPLERDNFGIEKSVL